MQKWQYHWNIYVIFEDQAKCHYLIARKNSKLKWTNCVLSAASTDNVNNRDSRSIIFTIKDSKLSVPIVTLSSRDNKKLSKLLAKNLKHQFIAMNLKQKVIKKIRQISLDVFLNQILLDSIDYFFSLYKSK